jgi:hypothetical protein
MARGSVQKTCPNCNTEFKTYLSQNKTYCCRKCADEFEKQQTYDKYKQSCEVCGKEFLPPRPAEGGRFCSYVCSGKSGRRARIYRSGYWRVCKPEHPMATKQGYVAEHRLVMEQAIGRYLEAGEVVHHINHDRGDNRIENLRLMSDSEHRAMHMRETRALGKFDIVATRLRDVTGKFTASAAGRRVDA